MLSWKSRFYLMSRNTTHLLSDIMIYYVGKAGFIWCHGTSSETSGIDDFIVGKAGFIWCHGTYSWHNFSRWGISWKSRFYLMSRNSQTPPGWEAFNSLEKPVLFDVTERMSGLDDSRSSRWKSRFYLMSRNTSFHPLGENRYVGKAGFIWCHGTMFFSLPRPWFPVGKAGFIWCHGTAMNSCPLRIL